MGEVMATFRVEKDSMGEVRVPAKAYYGAQSQRAVENFPVSGQGMPMPVVHAVALVKGLAARGQRGAGDPPGCPGGGDLPRRPGGPRGNIRRPVRGRRLPDRLGHLHQHERERGAGEPGERDPRRPRGRHAPVHPNDHVNRVPVDQRRLPVGDRIAARRELSDAARSRRSRGCGRALAARRRSSPACSKSGAPTCRTPSP